MTMAQGWREARRRTRRARRLADEDRDGPGWCLVFFLTAFAIAGVLIDAVFKAIELRGVH